jgi:hypothetical protein
MRHRVIAALLLAVLAACIDTAAPVAHSERPVLAPDRESCELAGTDAQVLGEITALSERVAALEVSGALTDGQARKLEKHLTNGERHLIKGARCQARASLQAFREQVENFVTDEVLTPAEAAPLLEGARRALEPDISPPVVTAILVTFPGSVLISHTLSDISGIISIRCRLDGGAFVLCGSGTSGQLSLPGLALGDHIVEIYGIDEYGNGGLGAASLPPPAPFARLAFANALVPEP